ncbi:MAG: hypothetical protein AAGA33_05245 [Pseudomonadota bacterium]
MKPALKRYVTQLFLTLLVYTVAIIGINLLDASMDLPVPVLVGLSLIPVIPAIYLLFIMTEFVRTLDEVQQKVVTESTLWSAGLVGIAGFTYGFLEGAVELPAISPIWILPALLMVQGIAQAFVRMRYL